MACTGLEALQMAPLIARYVVCVADDIKLAGVVDGCDCMGEAQP